MKTIAWLVGAVVLVAAVLGLLTAYDLNYEYFNEPDVSAEKDYDVFVGETLTYTFNADEKTLMQVLVVHSSGAPIDVSVTRSMSSVSTTNETPEGLPAGGTAFRNTFRTDWFVSDEGDAFNVTMALGYSDELPDSEQGFLTVRVLDRPLKPDWLTAVTAPIRNVFGLGSDVSTES
jgi:hypothetical protein